MTNSRPSGKVVTRQRKDARAAKRIAISGTKSLTNNIEPDGREGSVAALAAPARKSVAEGQRAPVGAIVRRG